MIHITSSGGGVFNTTWINSELDGERSTPATCRLEIIGSRNRDMQAGDIVLVTEDNAPRNDWCRGRVTKTFASADGHIRRVKVRVSSDNSENVLMHPVYELVLLLP